MPCILSNNPNLAVALEHLYKQECIILPTDTVWGIISFNQQSIYTLKQRPLTKQIIQFVNQDFLSEKLNPIQLRLIQQFWPGALTIVLNQQSYRCPNNEFLLSILKAIDKPLFCSSANLSGEPVITSATEAFNKFNSSQQTVMVYDLKSSPSLPSTIIDVDDWKILRSGAQVDEIINFLKQNNISCK